MQFRLRKRGIKRTHTLTLLSGAYQIDPLTLFEIAKDEDLVDAIIVGFHRNGGTYISGTGTIREAGQPDTERSGC